MASSRLSLIFGRQEAGGRGAANLLSRERYGWIIWSGGAPLAPPACRRRRRRCRTCPCRPQHRRTTPALTPARLQSLEFSHTKVIRSVHTGGVFCMDLDAGEQRYLLAGAADASIAVYDTQQPSPSEAQQQQEQAREAAGTVAALTANAPYLRDSAQVAAARSNTEHTEHAAVLSITKQSPLAHKFSVSAVAWYPVDSGLFVSGELQDEDG